MLGPLLFIIYINDLPDDLNNDSLIYADDSKLMAPMSEDELRNNYLQADIDKIVKWCNTWKMKLNISKCKVMHMGSKNKNRPYFMTDIDTQQSIQLQTTTIERDLGVLISADGSFSQQVDHAITCGYRALGRIKNTFSYLNKETLKILYPIYIRPHLEFASEEGEFFRVGFEWKTK